MNSPRSQWLKKEKRLQQFEYYVRKSRSALFGFTPYNESEKVKRVNQHFDTIAAHYDLMNTILSFGIHYLWKRMAIGTLDIKPGDKILDVCGGTGDMALLSASKTGEKGIAIVYDMNRNMLKCGKNKHLKDVTFVQGNAEMLAFPDDLFDAVSIGFGIRNLTHLETGFKEIFRVLKKGQKACCLEFSKPTNRWFRKIYDFYSFTIMPVLGQAITGSKEAYTAFPESIRAFPVPEEITQVLKDIGFSKVEVKELTNSIAVIHTCTK